MNRKPAPAGIIALVLISLFLGYRVHLSTRRYSPPAHWLDHPDDEASTARSAAFFARTADWEAVAGDSFLAYGDWMTLLRAEKQAEEMRDAVTRTESTASVALDVISEGRLGTHPSYAEHLPRLFPVIALAKREILAATLHKRSNHAFEAVFRLCRTRNMGRRLQEDGPFLIGHLVGISIESLVIEALADDFQTWTTNSSNADLDVIEQFLRQTALSPPDLERLLRMEHIYAVRTHEQEVATRDGPGVRLFMRMMYDPVETLEAHARFIQMMIDDSKSDFHLHRDAALKYEDGIPWNEYSTLNLAGFAAGKETGNLYRTLYTRSILMTKARCVLLALLARRTPVFAGLSDLVGSDTALAFNATTGDTILLSIPQRAISCAIANDFTNTSASLPFLVHF